MKTKNFYWLGMVWVLSLLMAACVTSIPSPQVKEPEAALSAATEELETAESVAIVEPVATESVATETFEPTESSSIEEPEPAETEVDVEISRTSPLIGEVVPDFNLPDGDGNMVSLGSALQENELVVVVFYYGNSCVPCMAQLTEIENDLAEYEVKGVQVIAIAIQPESGAKRSVEISGAQYPILADKDHNVTKQFGVFESSYLSTPSVFIINQNQEIIWGEISHIEGSGCGSNRIPSQTILENLG